MALHEKLKGRRASWVNIDDLNLSSNIRDLDPRDPSITEMARAVAAAINEDPDEEPGSLLPPIEVLVNPYTKDIELLTGHRRRASCLVANEMFGDCQEFPNFRPITQLRATQVSSKKARLFVDQPALRAGWQAMENAEGRPLTALEKYMVVKTMSIENFTPSEISGRTGFALGSVNQYKRVSKSPLATLFEIGGIDLYAALDAIQGGLVDKVLGMSQITGKLITRQDVRELGEDADQTSSAEIASPPPSLPPAPADDETQWTAFAPSTPGPTQAPQQGSLFGPVDDSEEVTPTPKVVQAPKPTAINVVQLGGFYRAYFGREDESPEPGKVGSGETAADAVYNLIYSGIDPRLPKLLIMESVPGIEIAEEV
jgi:hypothetical protein